MSERFSFGWFTAFFVVCAVVCLRVALEFALLSYPIDIQPDQHYLRAYLENIYYFLNLALLLAWLLSAVTRLPLLRTARFVAVFYPVILLPPVIDALMGRREGYFYATPSNFLWNLLTLSFVRGDASTGISIEILLGLAGIGVYAWYHTRSVLKALGAFFLGDLIIVLLSTPELFYPAKAYFIRRPFLPLYYFLPFLGLTAAAAWFRARPKLAAVLGNFRWVRVAAFACLVALGGWTRHLTGHRVYALDLFFAGLAIALVWKVAVVLNDIHDRPIDALSHRGRPLVTGAVSEYEYRLVAFLCGFVALSLLAVVNWTVLAIGAAALAMAWAYSVPPLRLRRTLAGYAITGASVAVAFLCGVSASGPIPLLGKDAVRVFALYLFALGCIVPMAKDARDIEGDSKNGVRNLFTVYGPGKGLRIYLVLFSVVLLASALIDLRLGLAALPLAAAACAAFVKWRYFAIMYAAALVQTAAAAYILFG